MAYCVGGDVKHCTIQSMVLEPCGWRDRHPSKPVVPVNGSTLRTPFCCIPFFRTLWSYGFLHCYTLYTLWQGVYNCKAVCQCAVFHKWCLLHSDFSGSVRQLCSKWLVWKLNSARICWVSEWVACKTAHWHKLSITLYSTISWYDTTVRLYVIACRRW